MNYKVGDLLEFISKTKKIYRIELVDRKDSGSFQYRITTIDGILYLDDAFRTATSAELTDMFKGVKVSSELKTNVISKYRF